jgi:hypothetical protein
MTTVVMYRALVEATSLVSAGRTALRLRFDMMNSTTVNADVALQQI